MSDFISIIGTIASVGSIPLAIYLYIKSSEQKVLKISREIVKSLSYQLGENRQLTSLEIQSVINSKTRENRIKSSSISVEEIIEDLMSETISNPLIENEKREFFLHNFQSLLSKNELYETIEKIALETKDFKDIDETKIDDKLRDLIKKQKKHREEIEKITSKRGDSFASLFGLIGAILSITAGIIAVLGKDSIDMDFLNSTINNKEIATIIISLTAGILTLTATTAIKKIMNKKE
ncbi:MAG: hypothetical protein CL605_09530 [Altibacter sp.]|uniref:hypothetical protein n=1 Tax=Altibacter sp. TaxID=2024823 RepID=UPI000C92D738|nr:hypothetical protein [Altibacter sp.]MAP55130.1 hypothetical protein [Altibacter sp.]|tara:strand:- start:789 stop:1496 length:708 start_codon:yes stop_codon:yes gene_type:complete